MFWPALPKLITGKSNRVLLANHSSKKQAHGPGTFWKARSFESFQAIGREIKSLDL